MNMSILDCLKIEDMELVDSIYRANNIPEADNIDFPLEGIQALDSINDISFWHKHRVECIRTAMNAILSERKILDVGGGWL